jgi:hypothetical protein
LAGRAFHGGQFHTLVSMRLIAVTVTARSS